MTKAEKEKIQYLLTQYLEGESTEKENQLLFELLDKEPDNTELEAIVEELIASEREQSNYERERWEDIVQTILANDSKEKNNVIESPFDEADTKVISISKRRRWPWIVSAAAMILIVASIWFVVKGGNKNVIATEYGEQKKISLQDETEITLNAHSSIKYSKRWKDDQPREVWLKGEAFFKVKHLDTDNKISEGERFLVHVKDVTVEVLGTSFDIRERRSKTEIVLESGKIKLSFNDGKRPDITMAPGQIVTISPNSLMYVKDSTINATDYRAWTNKRLVLNNGSLEEIIQYLEDNYGKKIIVQDTSLYRRQYQGMLMLDNLDDALFVLSKVLDVNIVKHNNTIFFKPK